MKKRGPPPKSIATLMEELITHVRKKGEMSLQECESLFGSRSIALVILLFSLVNSVPMPGIPGVSLVTGIPIVLLGGQLLFGAKDIWLPDRIEAYRLHEGKLLHALEKSLPYLRRAEKMIRPRALWLTSPPLTNLLGLLFIITAIMLALPIPFSNFPVGFSMSVLAIGLIAQDGVVTAIGIMLMLAAWAVTAVLFGTIAHAWASFM